MEGINTGFPQAWNNDSGEDPKLKPEEQALQDAGTNVATAPKQEPKQSPRKRDKKADSVKKEDDKEPQQVTSEAQHGEDDATLQAKESETAEPVHQAPQVDMFQPPPLKNVQRQAPGVTHEISIDILQLLNDARDRNNIMEYPAVEITELVGERCLIFYIPDVQTGIQGILPQSKAGLSRFERLEHLLKYPYVRFLPERINHSDGYCILNRARAEEYASRRAWEKIKPGDNVEAMILRSRRNGKGILCNVEGIISVMPVHEISHDFIEDAGHYFRPYQLVKAKVLDKSEFETSEGEKQRRLIISKKAIEFNPWESENLIPVVGQLYPGIITFRGPRYFHVQLRSGVSVLAKQPSFNYQGRENMKPGAEVTIFIVYVNRENRRVYGCFNRREVENEIKRYARFFNKQK